MFPLGTTRYLGVSQTAKQDVCRRLSEAIRNHQHTCYPVRNLTGRRWWQRAYREPEKWATAQVNDRHTDEGRRDIAFSPDGRIGVVCKREGGYLYVLEVRNPCADWDIIAACEGLVAGLSEQPAPGMYSVPYGQDDQFARPGLCYAK